MAKTKDRAAQKMARKRAASLTPARRREIARQASAARWAKNGNKQ